MEAEDSQTQEVQPTPSQESALTKLMKTKNMGTPAPAMKVEKSRLPTKPNKRHRDSPPSSTPSEKKKKGKNKSLLPKAPASDPKA